MKRFCLTLFVLFWAPSAFSSDALDPLVADFVSHARFTDQSLPVIIVYRRSRMENSSVLGDSPFAKQFELRHHVVVQQERLASVLSQRALRKLEPLWIARGSLVDLTAREILKVVDLEFVQGIFAQKKTVRMKSPKRSNWDLPRSNEAYTWGVTKMGVPQLRKALPHLTGLGVRVGVVDTGIDADHPDLKGKVKVYRDFTPAQSSKPSDEFEHGTHVAGTIAGGNASGRTIGVAPNVDLIVAKIFDGEGNSERAEILKAIQWVADPDGNPDTRDGAQVVNGSFGDDSPFDDRMQEDEPYCIVVESLYRMNVVPVFSAGNSGSAPGTVGLPAACTYAFAVGATNINDQAMWFSSSGPAIWKNNRYTKPDISAPGWEIVSARPGGSYNELGGTSMASPHIAGAFALLIQAFPDRKVKELEDILIGASRDLGDVGMDNTFGWGRPDVHEAIVNPR